MTQNDPMKISVIMPAYNAEHLLPMVLPPLLKMLADGEIQECIVVDDRSTDNTAALAREMGAHVMMTPKNGGPGAARNLAAEHAIGDILWLVDSDVIAWPGGAAQIREAFCEPGVEAVFGSYDSAPAGTPWISRYKNLTHRYYHQRAHRDSSTFWAGCGAVRAETYRRLGGFDVETYRVPSIEDIEFGDRIKRAGGRILLLPDLQGKHLKVWSLRNTIFTDIFRRALPWSRLIIARGALPDDLNTGKAERVKAAVAGGFFLSLFSLAVFPQAWPLPLFLLIAAAVLNWSFVRFMFENGGVWFAIRSFLFHQVYYVYSAAAFSWCLFEYHVLGIKDRLLVP